MPYQSGNPFYVDPGNNYLPGLQALSSGLTEIGQTAQTLLQGRQTQQKEQAALQQREVQKAGALDAYQSGDPVKMVEFAIQNPEFAKEFKMADLANHASEATYRNSIESSYEFLANPTEENLISLIEKRNKVLDTERVPAEAREETNALLDQFRANPEGTINEIKARLAFSDSENFNKWLEARGEKPATKSAEEQAFENLIKDMSPEEQEKARKIRAGLEARAVGSAAMTMTEQGTAGDVAETEKLLARAKEEGKLLAEWDLKPQVESAAAMAIARAKQVVEKEGEKIGNDRAYNLYETAMNGLAISLGGATTGPFTGWIPAMTTNAQIADGAVAAMAPILKTLFRAAGEGTFTDSDQRLLMDMVPTRKDTPEARVAKLQNIDNIVRAKLGIGKGQSSSSPPVPGSGAGKPVTTPPAPGAPPIPASPPPLVRTQAEFDALPRGSVYMEEDGKTYRKP